MPPSIKLNVKLIQEIIQWDIKSWSKALYYWENIVDWSKVENCLEIGGRDGGLSLWIGMKGKNVICSDIIDVKTKAESLHLKYGISSLVKYQVMDATTIPYENYFDIIVFKSVIGVVGCGDNLDKQKQVFSEIHKALKIGGKLLFAENMIASPLHQYFRKRFVKWGNSWRYVSVDEMKMFLDIFPHYKILSTGVLSVFGRTEKQRKVLAVIDSILMNRICPKRWKYISYGFAEK